ncbi:unnamed protein product [Rotaria socialis]|uniref:Uncharacterized protein n=1 Tax=Rotaria socialis TaxID=392032 RepID=A0A818CWI6_9BILA|nr:unnamed protein product [Rotaria socialis]CAF4428071.1 unnamed protein product [Rotaria socialis]
MAQSHRIRHFHNRKQEQEIHVIESPFEKHNKQQSPKTIRPSSPLRKETSVLIRDDYEAPLTAGSLRPNSRWLIVRLNLHRIRLMGFNNLSKEDRLSDLYLDFQVIRELKRAKNEINNVNKDKDFHMGKTFSLAGESGKPRVFNTSFVTPNDALIYDRIGEEPLVLQNLLYYFSKQNIEKGTPFWNLLIRVNEVLTLKHKCTVLVQRLRRLVLTLTIIFYSIIGFMFCLMIISVIITARKLDDPEVQWMNNNAEVFTNKFLLLR